MRIEILPAGDAAVMALVSEQISMQGVRSVWLLARALQASSSRPPVTDIVPAFGSVLVRFDPLRAELAVMLAFVRGVAEHCQDDDLNRQSSRCLRVRACFGPDWAADFDDVRRRLNVTRLELIEKLCRPRYRVAFLGFIAGFPYLLGLPADLAMPRRQTARPRVPAGSIAIAGGQCGIYPRASPGGWHLLGLTGGNIFDAALEPPALFAPGDEVRFIPVEEFDRVGIEVEA